MTFEEQTATSPDQLYNYLLTHEKRYEMRVLRMIPLFEDSGEETVSAARALRGGEGGWDGVEKRDWTDRRAGWTGRWDSLRTDEQFVLVQMTVTVDCQLLTHRLLADRNCGCDCD